MKFLNYFGFQLGWFACVAGAGQGHFLLGPLATVPLLIAHGYCAPNRRQEAKRIVCVAAFGLALELLALSFGQYRYVPAAALIPAWVVALWLLFAATLNSSFSWVESRPFLAAALGAVAGPMSFKAGVALGAGDYLAAPREASVVLCALWALALPGAFSISRRFNGRAA